MSLVELIKPDNTKPTRLLRDPSTGYLLLEYTGIDGNMYRVPVAIFMLPQEFGNLASLLGYTDLFEQIRTSLSNSAIILPVEQQSRYKQYTTLYSGTVTASGNSNNIDVSLYGSMRVEAKVTSISGTSPSIDVYVDGLYEGSNDWEPLLSKTGITATGSYFLGQVDNLAFRYIRVRWNVSGTSPSITFTVYAQVMA